MEQLLIGFVGLGVMGEPICRNLARRGGVPVVAFDCRREPLDRLQADGVRPAAALTQVAEEAAIIMLSLPSGREVLRVCEGNGGLLSRARPGQTIVDLGTSPVGLTRSLASRLGQNGIDFADAPVARTREAAQRGTLSAMVGASEPIFNRIEPLLRSFATDIIHCGATGAGQTVKLLNNMVLFETGIALAEALALGRRAGLDGALLIDALSKGSADSFALRHHARTAMLPEHFPQGVFSAEYALKDLGYALAFAQELGLKLRGAELAQSLLARAVEGGHGDAYWPVVAKMIEATG
jgi:3-hydroxyisobutyrate dehydrogenase-like beta-hydroxyacid dehydrogenase